jgi:hypothetical protein
MSEAMDAQLDRWAGGAAQRGAPARLEARVCVWAKAGVPTRPPPSALPP